MSDALIPSCDRKVRFWKNQKNTFGLLPGKEGSCPHCTTTPGGCYYVAPGRKLQDCYAVVVMHAYKGVRRVLEHNTNLLKKASMQEMRRLLATEFSRFAHAEYAHADRTGEPTKMYYRLHWSGDIFSAQYAKALANTMNEFPSITFRNYTRSFGVVKYFAGLENYIQFLSLDAANVYKGLEAYEKYKGIVPLRLCYMGDENVLNYMPCPVDLGKLSLDGGCAYCRSCFSHSDSNIFFKTK